MNAIENFGLMVLPRLAVVTPDWAHQLSPYLRTALLASFMNARKLCITFRFSSTLPVSYHTNPRNAGRNSREAREEGCGQTILPHLVVFCDNMPPCIRSCSWYKMFFLLDHNYIHW